MKDKEFLIQSSYDADADALFISKIDDYEYNESVELNNEIILDFDTKRIASALEILNASKVFNVSKYSLKNIKSISMEIVVLKESIHLKLSINIPIHNKELFKSLEEFTLNNINAPVMKTELATV